MILIHYGESFANIPGMVNRTSDKDFFTLALENGIPHVYRNVYSRVRGGSINLADDKWHHIAISIPYRNCLFSQVQMYVHGVQVTTKLEGDDDHLFLTSSGKISIGGK